jgi:nucleoside-diphosphate-sugar epimerase
VKVFLAGGTGAIGRRLIPMLLEDGHEVIGLARSPEAADQVSRLGVSPAIADALDRNAVVAAIEEARPDAIVHQLTAIRSPLDPKRIDSQLAPTNRLRTEGTKNLLEGARAAGATRFVTQSIAFAYDPSGEGLKSEEDSLWQRPPRRFAPVVDAVRSMESAVTDAGGTVLRYGHLYGPGTAFAADGTTAARVRDHQFPIVGGGTAVFSFTHVDDAAGATLEALRAGIGGIFNVVDDDPAPVREWLTEYARLLGAPAPGHVSTLVARVGAGEYGVAYLTQLKGASNAKAKRLLGWTPIHASWRSAIVDGGLPIGG